MSEHVFKLPDLGEGTVEAEIVEWHVKPGDVVAEGDIVVDVMTDKANIEVPAPVSGTVLRTSGEPGDTVAVGAELMALEVEGADSGPAPPSPKETGPEVVARGEAAQPADAAPPAEAPTPVPPPAAGKPSRAEAPDAQPPGPDAGEPVGHPAKVRTSPVIRRLAKEAGIDLTRLRGSGPRGRILRADLEAAMAGQGGTGAGGRRRPAPDEVEEIKVIGVRRVIARRMQTATREIPHFTYVEAVDVTALESLRAHLNGRRDPSAPALTYLPFIALATVRALAAFPQCNAHYDAEANVLRRFSAVHLGVATQTEDGLKVPVVRHAEAATLWQLAAEIARVAEAARANKASREELTGSTITITSLGKLGGIVSTPVINLPEVAIIGVNKAIRQPVVVDDAVQVRLMMNLSSSFDHRFVDGFDAASFIGEMKTLLEQPATLFMDA